MALPSQQASDVTFHAGGLRPHGRDCVAPSRPSAAGAAAEEPPRCPFPCVLAGGARRGANPGSSPCPMRPRGQRTAQRKPRSPSAPPDCAARTRRMPLPFPCVLARGARRSGNPGSSPVFPVLIAGPRCKSVWNTPEFTPDLNKCQDTTIQPNSAASICILDELSIIMHFGIEYSPDGMVAAVDGRGAAQNREL